MHNQKIALALAVTASAGLILICGIVVYTALKIAVGGI